MGATDQLVTPPRLRPALNLAIILALDRHPEPRGLEHGVQLDSTWIHAGQDRLARTGLASPATPRERRLLHPLATSTTNPSAPTGQRAVCLGAREAPFRHQGPCRTWSKDANMQSPAE